MHNKFQRSKYEIAITCDCNLLLHLYTQKILPLGAQNYVRVTQRHKSFPCITYRQLFVRIRLRLHWYSYLYQLLVQVTNLAFDFPRQVGK